MQSVIILSGFYLFQGAIIMAWEYSFRKPSFFESFKRMIFWPYYFIKTFIDS